MSKHQATTLKDRQSLVEQHQQGVSYAALSQANGWAVETIGKYCRDY